MKTSPKTPPALPSGRFDCIKLGELHLDRRNPRLVEYSIKATTSEDEVLEMLWDEMDVEEVAMSISASGFWTHEPLIVTEEGGEIVVIEGNRRLAAAKILSNPALMKKLGANALRPITGPELKAKGLEELPVIKVAKREDAWPYIGFKHVNGPQKWRSYAKAQYIAGVNKSTGTSLSQIAARIGDKHGTVQELYRALMVIEQAESAGVFKREYVKGRLAFSHLTTALQYPNFTRFLSIKDAEEESPKPIPQGKLKELGEVCRWLWGDRRDDTDRVVVSQNPNLRELEQVLGNKAATATLRSGHGLALAFDESKGDDSVFGEALQDAKNALVKAQGRVSLGYNGDPSLYELAQLIQRMAVDLVSIMSRSVVEKSSPRNRR